jgi:membrane-associated phospholipid phosphatase
MHLPEHEQHPIEQLSPSRTQKLLKAITSLYAIALAIAIGCAVAFGWLADEVLEHEFVKVNTAILLGIHAHDTPTLDRIALMITNLGSVYGIAILGLLLATGLLLSKRYVDFMTLLAVLIGAGVLVGTFKLLFHQARPQVFVPLAPEHDYSFPSGHSLSSFCLWGFFAWWIVSMGHRDVWRWLLAILGLSIAVLVALSRLYIGVHWPTDVIAGMLLAFMWIAVCVVGQHWLTRHARREKRQMQAQKLRPQMSARA